MNLAELKIISSKTLPWSFCKAWKCELISLPWFPPLVNPYLRPIRTDLMCNKSSNKMYICSIQTTDHIRQVLTWYLLIVGSIILYRISCYTVILEGVSTALIYFNILISNICFVTESASWYEFIFDNNNNIVWCDMTLYCMIHHVMFWKFMLDLSQWFVIVFHTVYSQVNWQLA